MPKNITEHLARVPPLVWISALLVAALVPFAGKALHIDDTLFVRAAQQIQRHPADFYGFSLNWWGTTEPMAANTDNPPLASYYLALAAALGGWSEWVLHLAFILPALAAAWGVFSLATRYCARPAVAATAGLLTPVFLISSTTLMCDVMLVAFWTWSVVWFEDGLQKDRPAPFLLSGVFAVLAAGSKFTGLAIVPLLAAYGLCRKRRLGFWLWALVLPVLFAAGYEWLSHRLYARSALLGAAGHAAHSPSGGYTGLNRQILGLSYVGGCFFPILFYVPWLWPGRNLLRFAAMLLAGCLLPFLTDEFKPWLWHLDKHLNWLLLLQSAVFITGGLQILVLALTDFWERRDAVSLMLLLWILGLFVFATAVYMLPNGRILLPMTPAVGILVARRLDKHPDLRLPGRAGRSFWPALPALALSLLLVRADFDLANTGRTAARQVCAKYLRPGKTLWFEGHWGFQYYMERNGAKALERNFALPKPGDCVVVPSEAVNAFDFPAAVVQLVDTFEYTSTPHWSTMSLSAGAGFYTAKAGPFPFSAGEADPERYYVFEVTQAPAAAGVTPNTAAGGAMAQQFELERKSHACAEAVRGNPANAEARLGWAACLYLQQRKTQAIEQYRTVLRLTPDSVRALGDLAWILATDADPQFRNAAEAVRLAERANDLTGRISADLNTTLAAAYAEAGKFELAVATAQQAIGLARKSGQAETVATNERLLQLYRSNRPFHQ